MTNQDTNDQNTNKHSNALEGIRPHNGLDSSLK